MANWANKKCGNCGFVASGDSALAIVHCNECGRDMCPKCYGGDATGEMCKDCRYKQPETKAYLRRLGLG